MTGVDIDSLDRALLDLIQIDFPLVREPFRALATAVGVSEREVIHRIARLKENKVVKSIGPVFNSRSLGYHSTLVGMRLSESRLEQAARLINQHPGVSHNYARDHRFNLWFTLILPNNAGLQQELPRLAELVKAEDILNLPTLRIFKVKVYFDLMGQPSKGCSPDNETYCYIPPLTPPHASPQDWAVITKLQPDLPLTMRPFEAMAASLNMSEDEFLKQCCSLKERGIMRRFGALIRHHNVGFALNAMVSWLVPSARIEIVGGKMASFPKVSHCCERETRPQWPYNLFTVIHGKENNDLDTIVQKLSWEADTQEYVVLPTVKEFKNETITYLPPPV